MALGAGSAGEHEDRTDGASAKATFASTHIGSTRRELVRAHGRLFAAEFADAQACSAFAAGGPICSGEPVGSVPGGSEPDRFVGNPIDVVTGNKYQYREDYRARARPALRHASPRRKRRSSRPFQGAMVDAMQPGLRARHPPRGTGSDPARIRPGALFNAADDRTSMRQHGAMTKSSFPATTAIFLIASWPGGVRADKDRISLESDALWEAFERKDLSAFDAVLERGVLDTAAFQRHEVHFTLCEATLPGKERFLGSILGHGIDPDVRNATVSALDRNALACAATRYNIETFDILLEAGADTTANLRAGCRRQKTLFTLVSNKPPFSSRILDRRRLTSFEAENLAWQVETISLVASYEGRPTYAWYQEVSRGYGIDGLQPFGARVR